MVAGQHPIMLSFCHGSQIHDVFTQRDVPEQEELMFIFPVMVSGRMCSYVPVLYLNSTIGTLGGLYFGLRKQYHPEMRVYTNPDDNLYKRWEILSVIDAQFHVTDPPSENNKTSNALPQFIDRVFNEQPFVTRSYFGNTRFYKAQVYPSVVSTSQEKFSWWYKDANLRDSRKTSSVYAEYWFSMSRPMDYDHYFSGSKGEDDVAKSAGADLSETLFA